MATDKEKVHVVPGDLITIKCIVREVNPGQAGKNIRVEPVAKGDLSEVQHIWLNSAQTEKLEERKPEPTTPTKGFPSKEVTK